MHPPWETIKISGGRNHRHDGCALICNSRFGIRTSSHARRFRRRSACFTFRNIRILYELLRVPCFMPRCLATPLPPSSPFLPQERYRFFFFFFLSIRVSIPSSCPLVAIYLPSSSFPGILKFATKDIDTKIAGGEGR